MATPTPISILFLGLAWEAHGDLEHDASLYVQVLTMAQIIGDAGLEGIGLGNLANMYALKEEHRQAIASYERALVLKRAVADRDGEAITSWNLGMLLVAHGDCDRAVELLQGCVEYERSIQHPEVERDAATLEEIRKQKQ